MKAKLNPFTGKLQLFPNLISDITGLTTTTDNAVVRWDGTAGGSIQNSGIVIDDSDNMTFNNAAAPSILSVAATATVPTLIPNKADLDTGLGWAATNALSLIAGGTEGIRITQTPIGAGQTVAGLSHTMNAVLGADTGNEAAFTLNYTTNKATSGDDTGLEINQTDTLSPGTSYGINYKVGGSSKFNVKNNGGVCIGMSETNAMLGISSGAVQTTQILSEIVGIYSDVAGHLALSRAQSNSNGNDWLALKARGSHASKTTVIDEDNIGNFNFWAYDGTSYRQVAILTADVDVTPANSTVPGRLRFLTTPTGVSQTAIERMRIDNVGNVGIGTTSPDQLLHAEKASALTATVQPVARFTHITSGTPANNIGVGIEFEQETSADNNEVIATIEAVVTDVTSTSEDADLIFKTMAAGATAAEKFRVVSTGSVNIPTGQTYNINNVPHTHEYLGGVEQALTCADNVTIDWDSGATAYMLFDRATVAFTLSNGSNGKVYRLRLLQDGTGSRLATWVSAIKWKGGSAPTLTTTINKSDWITFVYSNSEWYADASLDF